MKLQDIKNLGGIVNTALVKRSIEWGKNKGEIFVQPLAFGVVDEIFSSDDGSGRKSSKLLAASVRLGDKGEERMSIEMVYSLDPVLANAMLDAVTEVNGLKVGAAKN